MKIKVAYIISQIDKALAFEWIATHLDKSKFELIFILLNNEESELENFLNRADIKLFRVNYLSKRSLVPSFFRIRRLLIKHKVSIVHAHLFEASLIGLLAARSIGIQRRIHTRHNATIHHVYFPKAVIFDKFINYLSTEIIAISAVVQNVLIEMEGVKPSKIKLIHHGFDFSIIPKEASLRVKELQLKYNPRVKWPIVGVISRYIHWKGVEYIIMAFKDLLLGYPDAKLLLANTEGPYKSKIKKMLSSLPAESYIEIRFEADVFALYKLFDVFVHTPIDPTCEAFGQVYIEALASGIPSVFTISGIAHKLIKDKENAIVVEYKNYSEIRNAIEKLLTDSKLREALIVNGKTDVIRGFGIDQMMSSLENLYLSSN
jgi:glycosyltransferase involved in cell wall biosynthesis